MKAYTINTSFDDDEEIFEYVVMTFLSKSKADEVCDLMNKSREQMAEITNAVSDHMFEWNLKHKPKFALRLGAYDSLPQEEKDLIAQEKIVWQSYLEEEQTEEERFRKTLPPKVIVDLPKEAVVAINEHLFHDGDFYVEQIEIYE